MAPVLKLAPFAACLCVLSCGDLPHEVGSGSGSLNVNVWVVNPSGRAKAARALETTWNKLVVRVTADDMDTILDTTAAGPDGLLYTLSLAGVAAGDDRLVEGWTESASGTQIHYGQYVVARLDPGESETVALLLDATRGSIYINLAEIPSTVDSIFACFEWSGDTLWTRVARAGLVNLSIDEIPDGADGLLIITAVGTAGDTLYDDTLAITFDADASTSLHARFASTPGELSTNVTIVRPGATVVSGFMETEDSTGPEVGPLIVSEVMYYALGDSDYIEIHNPTTSAVVLDTLVLLVVETSSTTTRYLLDVNIPAKGYLVVGDSDAPRSDATWNIDTTTSYNLTTTGRWIVLKRRLADGSLGVIDWVAYLDGVQGWPDALSRYAIELDSLPDDPAYNNHGRCWQRATAQIGASGHYGSPGS